MENNVLLNIYPSSSRTDVALLIELTKQYPWISRRTLKTWFHEKKIFYKKQSISASLLLSPGIHEIFIKDFELLSLKISPALPSLRGSFLPIIFEDENLLILNKTPGIPSLPHKFSESETAVGSALAHFPGLATVGRQGFEPGLLHRLDTGTSGLLVFAKNQPEFERLSFAWKNRSIKKRYRALVELQLPIPAVPFVIDYALAHHPRSPKKMIALDRTSQRFYRGKPFPAHTTVCAVFPLEKAGLADFEIEIKTGVTHQIRCHLSTLGWPILGDPIYRKKPGVSENLNTYSRLWLHAWRLTIPLEKEKFLNLEAPLPTDWPQ